MNFGLPGLGLASSALRLSFDIAGKSLPSPPTRRWKPTRRPQEEAGYCTARPPQSGVFSWGLPETPHSDIPPPSTYGEKKSLVNFCWKNDNRSHLERVQAWEWRCLCPEHPFECRAPVQVQVVRLFMSGGNDPSSPLNHAVRHSQWTSGCLGPFLQELPCTQMSSFSQIKVTPSEERSLLSLKNAGQSHRLDWRLGWGLPVICQIVLDDWPLTEGNWWVSAISLQRRGFCSSRVLSGAQEAVLTPEMGGLKKTFPAQGEETEWGFGAVIMP